MKPVHERVEEAFQLHWVGKAHSEEGSVLELMERNLNEVFLQALTESPDFHTFYPFPVRVRVVKKDKEFGWGFLGVGEEEAIEWIQRIKGEAFNHNFPRKRWIKYSLPLVSKNEVLAAFSQVIHAFGLREGGRKDTLEILIEAGVFDHLREKDLGTIALSRLLDGMKPDLQGEEGSALKWKENR